MEQGQRLGDEVEWVRSRMWWDGTEIGLDEGHWDERRLGWRWAMNHRDGMGWAEVTKTE